MVETGPHANERDGETVSGKTRIHVTDDRRFGIGELGLLSGFRRRPNRDGEVVGLLRCGRQRESFRSEPNLDGGRSSRIAKEIDSPPRARILRRGRSARRASAPRSHAGKPQCDAHQVTKRDLHRRTCRRSQVSAHPHRSPGYKSKVGRNRRGPRQRRLWVPLGKGRADRPRASHSRRTWTRRQHTHHLFE